MSSAPATRRTEPRNRCSSMTPSILSCTPCCMFTGGWSFFKTSRNPPCLFPLSKRRLQQCEKKRKNRVWCKKGADYRAVFACFPRAGSSWQTSAATMAAAKRWRAPRRRSRLDGRAANLDPPAGRPSAPASHRRRREAGFAGPDRGGWERLAAAFFHFSVARFIFKSIRPNGTPAKNWSPGLVEYDRIRAADFPLNG